MAGVTARNNAITTTGTSSPTQTTCHASGRLESDSRVHRVTTCQKSRATSSATTASATRTAGADSIPAAPRQKGTNCSAPAPSATAIAARSAGVASFSTPNQTSTRRPIATLRHRNAMAHSNDNTSDTATPAPSTIPLVTPRAVYGWYDVSAGGSAAAHAPSGRNASAPSQATPPAAITLSVGKSGIE